MKTGRPPLSDAEKKLRGTLDPRWTEEARAQRAEDKVVSLFGGDRVEEIPPPPAGLTEKAQAEYWRWTRRLHEVGRLTQVWVEKCAFYAVRKHSIETRLAQGKPIKDGDVKAAELFLKELGALNVDQPRGGQEAPRSKWDRVGFASGRRTT
jgi:hypothetical protein